MAKRLHRSTPATENHVIQRWEVANAAARLALVPAAADLGGVARQADDGSLWSLKSMSPTTWRQIDPDQAEFAAPAAVAQAAAEYAQSQAEAARDAAVIAGKVYVDTAAGLAGTAEGAYFTVPSGAEPGEALILYRKESGVAVEKKRYPSSVLAGVKTSTLFAYALADDSGHIAFGVKPDGTMVVRSLEAVELAPDRITRGGVLETPETVTGFQWAFVDAWGNIALGLRDDGTVVAGAVQADSLAAISATADVLNGVTVADTAVWDPPYAFEINHVLTYGQSLADGDQATPPQTTSQRHNSLRFVGGVRPSDGGVDPAVIYASLVALIETTSLTLGETPTAGTLEAINDLVQSEEGLAYSAHQYQLLGSAPGEGSKTIAQLSKGSNYYTDLITHITKGLERAGGLNRTYGVRAVTWTQGESDLISNTARATYLASLLTLVSDLQTDIKAASGQAGDVPLITYQMATHKVWSRTTPSIALALLDGANQDARIFMACPLYFLAHAADNVHLTAASAKKLGAYYGLVYKRVIIDGQDWSPLQPISAIRQGAVATLRFSVPVGPLVLDTTLVAANTNYGFELVDSGGSPLTISAVELLGDDRMKITAASAIPAGAKVRYAWTGAGTTGPTVGPRGNLRDSQGASFIFDPTGVNHPMHNWCVLFEYAL